MKRRFYVYALYSPDGAPFYVGKGTGSRMHRHALKCEQKRNPTKYNTIKNIEAQGLKLDVRVLRWFKLEESAFTYERKIIASIGRKPVGPLTNLTDGGDGTCGFLVTNEARRKMSKAGFGKKKPPGHGTAVSNALRNSKAFKAYKAKGISIETRKKIGDAHRGRKRSPELRAKIAAANSRRVLSETSKQKIADSLRKYFETHPEVRDKISEQRRKKIDGR